MIDVFLPRKVSPCPVTAGLAARQGHQHLLFAVSPTWPGLGSGSSGSCQGPSLRNAGVLPRTAPAVPWMRMEEEEGASPGQVWVCGEVLDAPLPSKGRGAAVLPGENAIDWGKNLT